MIHQRKDTARGAHQKPAATWTIAAYQPNPRPPPRPLPPRPPKPPLSPPPFDFPLPLPLPLPFPLPPLPPLPSLPPFLEIGGCGKNLSIGSSFQVSMYNFLPFLEIGG